MTGRLFNQATVTRAATSFIVCGCLLTADASPQARGVGGFLEALLGRVAVRAAVHGAVEATHGRKLYTPDVLTLSNFRSA
jgi:hypothetical protein